MAQQQNSASENTLNDSQTEIQATSKKEEYLRTIKTIKVEDSDGDTKEINLHIIPGGRDVKYHSQEFVDEALEALESMIGVWAKGYKQREGKCIKYENNYAFHVRENITKGTDDDYIWLEVYSGKGDNEDKNGGAIPYPGWKALGVSESGLNPLWRWWERSFDMMDNGRFSYEESEESLAGMGY